MTTTYNGTQNLKDSVVRFSAEWCGPCKAFAPLFDKVAEQDEDTSYVVVDVDEYPEVASEYGIKSIPAVFNRGSRVTDHMEWARKAIK